MTFSKLPPPISPVNASGVRIKTPEALKPAKWSLWSYKPYWELWDACCLTFDFEPNQDGLHTWLTYKRLPNNFPADFADRLLILTSNFKTNVGGEVSLFDVAELCLRCGWPVPHEMKSLIKTPVSLVAASVVSVVSVTAEKPWEVADPTDPEPEQPWYTPARYFARQFAIENATLLTKRLLLADKVSAALLNAGYKKRGKKKKYEGSTVLKAFANVPLG